MFRALIACLCLGLAAPAAAQTAKPIDPALIAKAEAALVKIDAMTSDFTYNNANGAHTGRLFVDRVGGRLRMEFDPPMNHLIIANGERVDYIGGDGTVLNAGVEATPLELIFGADSRLSGDVQVVETAVKGKAAYIAVAQTGKVDEGQVILHFSRSEPDWTLKGWGYVSSAGGYTRTALRNMRFGADFDDALFVRPERN